MNKEKEAATNVPTPNESENQASASRNNNEASTSTENREKNREESIVHGGSTDFSRVPIPVCSCTGVRRECHKFAGGWRSTCCTASLSEYPLPFTSSRPKKRIMGRSITKAAYKKILERLAAEGHDLLWGVDLKNHWARA
ncbi:protein BASIC PENTACYSTEINE7-like, partial [Phalaenopsis equestris]|uniref:protein BASIC PENTACYSTEINE7-like n=1 Tax=Phalaenopsis equestris TaxID=78828 RepID=UPI0009E1AB9A